jgi:DNA-binding NarL/FixJ family response regulator
MKHARVLLADDHPVILEGLCAVLSPPHEIVGQVRDGRALIVAADELKPDVIVADISMPLLNGLEAVRQLKALNRRVKVIFLTMHAETDLATQAFRAGAVGYVLKSSAAELQIAVDAVLQGRTYVTPRIAENVQLALTKKVSEGVEQPEVLTPRQREVLQLLAEGRRAKEIADILQVSTKTVEFHKGRIKETLGVRTIAELTQYALKHCILVVQEQEGAPEEEATPEKEADTPVPVG